jgi:hypothetical protein
MPKVLGGVGALVVIVLIVVMNSGGKETADKPRTPTGSAGTPAAAPAPSPAAATPAVALGAARGGKAPTTPAPALTVATLEQAHALLNEAKELNNEGVRLRTAGKNQEARDAQSQAKDKIDAIKQLVAKPSEWQELADMEGWAQPAEYVALEKLYGEVAKIEKRIRMGGGT